MIFDHASALPESRKTVKDCPEVSEAPGEVSAQPEHPSKLIGDDDFRSARLPRNPVSHGYARVSTGSQIPDRQLRRLEAECDALHLETISGAAAKRPVFDALIASLRAGDYLVVLDLDRAFRSSIDAMLTADLLRQRAIGFRILTLDVDTRTPEGELFYSMVAAFAQYERRIISRRTREGLEAARQRGVRLGRPSRLPPDVVRDAHTWMAETGLPCRYVAALLGVSRLTLQRSFHRLNLSYPDPLHTPRPLKL